MKTHRQEMLDEMLDPIEEEWYITEDWQGVLDDLDAKGIKDVDDLDPDTYYSILKDHDIEPHVVDQRTINSPFVKCETLYTVYYAPIDNYISYLETRDASGEWYYEVQSDLQGSQAESLDEIDDYDWQDVGDMLRHDEAYL
jgi:hypothetical protein